MMDNVIDLLGEATILSTLHARSGFWRIEMDEKDLEKKAFKSHGGLYQFDRMSFGLENAPATIQPVMDVIRPP